jgi:hypothetical protein
MHNRAFDLTRNVGNVLATITARRSSVQGVARDDRGAPVGDCLVVVFPDDRTLWQDYGATPIYLHSQRPSVDGEFAFVNVPPGEYRVAAIMPGGKGYWYEPGVLAGLVSRAKRISVKPGATLSETLIVSR